MEQVVAQSDEEEELLVLREAKHVLFTLVKVVIDTTLVLIPLQLPLPYPYRHGFGRDVLHATKIMLLQSVHIVGPTCAVMLFAL